MRVLEIAPLWERVPPPAYGGTEAVVSLLVEELVRRGHEVTLCASGDSITSACLFSVYPRSLRTGDNLEDKDPYLWLHGALSLAQADSFDVVHNHNAEMVMAMSHMVGVPMLSTMHCLVTPSTKIIWDHYQGYYNTISRAQRRNMPLVRGGTFLGAVYNAIDVASFPYQEEKEDFLLFLSRISPEKGPHLAVEVARRVGMKLVIAGKVDPNQADQQYFEEVLRPLVDGRQVEYLGEADGELKRDLYRRARCLLVPLLWEEPFGLVMAEAMACGTPVITFKRGAAAEVVADGKTGFLVSNVAEMVAAIQRLDEISPRSCRQHVEENFDIPMMADCYLALYEEILRREARGGAQAAELALA
ncbi:MAG TPA: glycosyltransferase family 4 protein [Dehalococcoidia bacterium]|nr:glycosyltransferase family 4 protein [Dehalococcoidia bacterium]